MKNALLSVGLMLVSLCMIPLPAKAALQRLNIEFANFDMSVTKPTDIAQLGGNWLYFPGQIVKPKDFLAHSQDLIASAPTIVIGSGFTDGDKPIMKSGQGYASYLMRLNNLPDTLLAIWGWSAFTSARIYFFAADGSGADHPLDELGHFSEIPSENLPQMARQSLPVLRPFGTQTHYLLIQVANFHHTWGGVWIPPSIARYETAQSELNQNRTANFWLIGVTSFVAIYSLGLYLRRREDVASLWLFAYAIERSLRTYWFANNGTDWLHDLKLSYEFNYKLQWFFWLPSTVFALGFFRACFPRQTPKWLIPAFLLVAGGPYLFALATPVMQHYDFIKPFYSLLNPLVGIFTGFIILRAYRQKEEGALWLIIGLVAMVSGGIVDIFYTFGYTFFSFNNTSGVSMAIFLVCQSQVIAHRFAQAFRKAEYLSKELKVEVDRQTRDIKSILDSIKQGIFSIHSSKEPIDSQFSAHLVDITGAKDLATRNIQSLLLERTDLDADQRDQITSCLDASLGESMLGFELNSGNLVHELSYHSLDGKHKVLEVDWIPMLDHKSIIEKVLINLRDVTEVRKLKEIASQQEEDLKILIELIHIPEDRFHRFLNKTREYLKQNRDLVLQFEESRPEVLKQLFVNMHTIKGTARTYLLRAISNATHEVEDSYQKLAKGQNRWNQKILLEDLTRIESLVEKYHNVGTEKLGWQLSERLVKIPSTTLETVVSSLNKVALEYLNPFQKSLIKSARNLLYNAGFVRMQDVIDEASRGLDSIARDLEKLVPRIEGDLPLVVLKDQGVNLMHAILVHLLRNSMDHGIEKPSLRATLGKEAEGKIYLSGQLGDKFLHLSYSDDGSGLNLDAIREKAIAKGLIKPDAKFEAQLIANLIFEAGLSTKSSVSDISGRGVGLDAVRRYVEEVGGKIKIVLAAVEDIEHVPFHFEFEIPGSYCIPLDNDNLELAS